MALMYMPEDEIDFKDLGYRENVTILDFIHDQLEHSTDVEGNEKWKNTLDFLNYVNEQTS